MSSNQPSDPIDDLKKAVLAAFRKTEEPIQPDQNAIKEELIYRENRHKVEIDGLSQDIKLRKKYASLFFKLGCTWICVIIVILGFQGFGESGFYGLYFRLDKDVVLAAIGATTVNILGLLYVVAKYLFPKE